MSWGFRWRPYVSVAQRRAKAARETAHRRKNGSELSPVQPAGRQVATTFWGKAWCNNLEAYSDYENRLPRGRTYVRNGSVIDLRIAAGEVKALVQGSDLYKIRIRIQPLAEARWKSILSDCAGKIDSLIELLQGRLSAAVMQIVTRPEQGLFPAPKEISLSCSCPDWADMCKHVAAALYGVGTRLDAKPELIFLLRGVDPVELIGRASAAEAVRQVAPIDGTARMDETELADVFGIEIDSQPAAAPVKLEEPTPPAYGAPEPAALVPSRPRPVRTKRVRAKPASRLRQMSAAARKRIAEAMKARWRAVRDQKKVERKPIAAKPKPRTRKVTREVGR
jgi:uncharacterized Zn finger protein